MNNTSDYALDKVRGDARQLPEYWGRWFVPLRGGGMKQTNLSIFYKFGVALEEVNALKVGSDVREILNALLTPQAWLQTFLNETEGTSLKDSRAIAERFIERIDTLICDERYGSGKPLTISERGDLYHLKRNFEDAFTREALTLKVFAVTRKGLYDTNALIDEAERKFPDNLLNVMPTKTIHDLKEAGRCLAFEVPTACAFHVCRATEALMLRYYEALAGQPWPYTKRDWKAYNDHLIKHGAPQGITTRLDEIRAMDRNAYAHPDTNVEVDEAQVVFDLCNAVIFFMAKEIEKLEAAKVAASNPPSKP